MSEEYKAQKSNEGIPPECPFELPRIGEIGITGMDADNLPNFVGCDRPHKICSHPSPKNSSKVVWLVSNTMWICSYLPFNRKIQYFFEKYYFRIYNSENLQFWNTFV